LKVGVSGLAILGAQAGPVVSFPLAFTLTFNAQEKCKLNFEIGFAVVLGISAEVTFLSKQLVRGEVATAHLYDKSLYEKCISDAFFGTSNTNAKKSRRKKKY